MDFAHSRWAPGRHLTGVMLVVLLHAALVYVLVTGLARRGVEIVRRPIETEIIEEPRKLPPPPPKLVLPPPPLGAPPSSPSTHPHARGRANVATIP